MTEWPYTIVVPALVLRDLPGERQSARIDFEPPLDLGNRFCIDFWFKPEAYTREASTPVLVAGLRTGTDEPRDLLLRLDSQHLMLDLWNYSGPLSDAPPVDRWSHISLLHDEGELRLICWQEGKPADDTGQSVKLPNEHFRLGFLALASENGAAHLFSELRLRKNAPGAKARAEDRQRVLIGDERGLVGYWKVDEGSGDLMIDSSLSANDGIIAGGSYRADSGLQLRIAEVLDGPLRWYHEGRTKSDGGERTHWKDPAILDRQLAHLDKVEPVRKRLLDAANAAFEALAAPLDAAREEVRGDQAKLEGAYAAFETQKSEQDAALEKEHQRIEEGKRKALAAIESSQKIHLKDFIFELQKDLQRGRDSIRRDYGRIYGLDAVNMDVKVVPGVGGIGLHLPEPEQRIDPGRLSTLRLRFRAAPEEDETTRKAFVPPLERSTEDFARRKLTRTGFRVDVVYQVVADAADEGRVLAQLYDGEDGQAKLGSLVTLVVGQRR